MFTGIITDIGEVTSVNAGPEDRRIRIRTSYDMDSIDIGASIACSGCCLTVTEKGDSEFAVDVSAESLSKTVIGSWAPGTGINLERSLRFGDELGGHLVSGHIDGLAELVFRRDEGGSRRLKFKVPESLFHFLAPKGSVAVDGVSLTVNEVEESNIFGVNIIPYTLDHTTLGSLRPGDAVNLEVDMLARYVARILGKG